jgi:hypothetical protein
MYETAEWYADQALKTDPENKRLQSNLLLIQQQSRKPAAKEES